MFSLRAVSTLAGIAILSSGSYAAGELVADEGSKTSKPDAELKIGGVLRLNAFVKSWIKDDPGSRLDIDFEVFNFDVSGQTGDWGVSIQYRLYESYNLARYAYITHPLADGEIRAGLHAKPFGLLPYGSHSWFFNLPFYAGMEDDIESGLLYNQTRGNETINIGYFFADEGSFHGSSRDSTRYSYDISHADTSELGGLAGPRRNEERGQLNLRYENKVASNTTLGISAEMGRLYNSTTDLYGERFAMAAHAKIDHGDFNTQFQAIRYGNDLRNPEGQDERFTGHMTSLTKWRRTAGSTRRTSPRRSLTKADQSIQSRTTTTSA
jgi:hypothetical protein